MPYLKSEDGYKIYYNYLKGHKKSVLVFVHGWLVNWTCFKEEIKYFHKKGYPVLYLDLRGHGNSDKPQELKSYALSLLVKDLNAILEKKNIKRIILTGHSMGGMVALLFSMKYPKKVKDLIIIDSSYKNPLFSSTVGFFNKHQAFIRHLSSYLVKHTNIRNSHFRHVKEPDFSALKSRTDQTIFLDALVNTPSHACFCALESMFNFDVEKDLKNITAPTLILSSSRDQFFSTDLEESMAKNIRHSKYKMLSGTHSIIIKKPREISREMEKFISKS